MGTTAARIVLLTLAVGLASGAKAEPDIYSANYVLPACKALANNQAMRIAWLRAFVPA